MVFSPVILEKDGPLFPNPVVAVVTPFGKVNRVRQFVDQHAAFVGFVRRRYTFDINIDNRIHRPVSLRSPRQLVVCFGM